MTEEDKQLLCKDLCGRLPHGVMCNIQTRFVFEDGTLRRGGWDKILDLETVTEINDWHDNNELERLKPYLRPLSSMTDAEEMEYNKFFEKDVMDVKCHLVPDYIDWLNAHHFDWRGLISKGLALPAPEGMYND